jgi:predicted secreted Zn-dependent protease
VLQQPEHYALKSSAKLHSKSRKHITRTLLFICLVVLLYGNLIRISAGFWYPTGSALPQAVATASAQAQTETTTYAPTGAPNPDSLSEAELVRQVQATATQPTTTDVQVSQYCSGTPYSIPTPINLSLANNGLSKTIDSPTYYRVYGQNLAAVRQSIADCPFRQAAGNYQAATTYQLGWSYSIRQLTNGNCSLSNVRVGLHINQLMPAYDITSDTPAALAKTWNAFAANLAIHEASHVAFDTQYTEKILAALQNMESSCGSISSQAQTTIDANITMLNGTNDLYDAQTNHGATQGAVL